MLCITFKSSLMRGRFTALRYLEKEYRECMARGEEPPFDLDDLLRRYGSSPLNSEVSAPPSSSAPARNPLEHSVLQRKDG